MSLDADTIVDRRRMRRKLTLWRSLAVLLAIVAVIAAGYVLRGPGSGMLPGADEKLPIHLFLVRLSSFT